MKTLLAHGSTASSHGEQLKTLASKVSALLDEEVGTAFLSDDLLPQGGTVLPLFLGEGKHVCEDVPKLADVSDCIVLPPLANHAEAIAELVLAALTRDTRRIHALFVVYRFGDFEQLVAALYAKAKTCSKHALASLHTDPGVDVLLQHWQREGVKAISLQPILLFEGHSLGRLQTMVSESNMAISMAPVLSDLAGFPELIADIFNDEAGKDQ